MTEERRRGKRVMGVEGPDRWVGINPDPSYLPSIFHSAGRWISCSTHSQVGWGAYTAVEMGAGVVERSPLVMWVRGIRGQRRLKRDVLQQIQVVEEQKQDYEFCVS